MRKSRFLKYTLWTIIALFLLLNVITAVHAYKFTHFTTEKVPRIKDIHGLTFFNKVKILFTGISYSRPADSTLPVGKYENIKIQSNVMLDCWLIPADAHKGTVILFHGHLGSKSGMIQRAYAFNKMGYNTLLVDCMGSGGSGGDETTIGYKEAMEVKSCYEYMVQSGEKNIILFGSSMGAAAILKAMHDYPLQPGCIIIECPFGSLYTTVCARFRNMGLPIFPSAALLTFWGGVENGFWAFSFNPSEYAKAVKCPALLMYGAKDKNVSWKETCDIYDNMAGTKQLHIFKDAGHANYLSICPDEWLHTVSVFLHKPGNDTLTHNN